MKKEIAISGVKALATRPDLSSVIDRLARSSMAKESRRALESDLRLFREWCRASGVSALPADVETIIAFVADLSDKREVASIDRYLASVSKAHRLSGFQSPTKDGRVRMVMDGLRREKGKKSPNAKAALTPSMIRKNLDRLGGDHIRGIRDRAVILVGLTTALRRSEIAGLRIEDLSWVDDGVVATIRRSKTDQYGEGREVAIPRLDSSPEVCPVRALRSWLDVVREDSGPVFRGLFRGGKIRKAAISPGEVSTIVKRMAKEADRETAEFGGHSLRAGYVTAARLAGLDWGTIMEQTGHRKVETVKRYMRDRLDPLKATRVGDVMRSAFEAHHQNPDSFQRIGTGILAKRIGLPPPPADDRVIGQFAGNRECQRLSAIGALWMEVHGGNDGRVIIEIGNSEAEKVVDGLISGREVLVIPYRTNGVTGILFSGTPDPNHLHDAIRAVATKLDEET